MTELSVNGVTAKALVDTGSPATIVSVKFAMTLLATEWANYGNTLEWMGGYEDVPWGSRNHTQEL